MYYRFFVSLLVILICSCEKPNPQAQIHNLNGYWEIKSVTMPSGYKKDFGINTIVDYIEVRGDSGTRTKVSPKLDGTFVTNGTSEKFVLKIESDSLHMYYQTPFDSWKETVIKAKDSSLTVVNKDKKIYHYTKYKTFRLQEKGAD